MQLRVWILYILKYAQIQIVIWYIEILNQRNDQQYSNQNDLLLKQSKVLKFFHISLLHMVAHVNGPFRSGCRCASNLSLEKPCKGPCSLGTCVCLYVCVLGSLCSWTLQISFSSLPFSITHPTAFLLLHAEIIFLWL